MNVYNISKKELKNLILFNTISPNTEGQLFIFDKHNKWYKEKNLFKKFFIIEGETFSNKLYTINNLLELKENCDINGLVLPNSLISVNHQIHGFSLPFIENSSNYSEIQRSSNIPLEDKLNILKQYGTILEKVHKYPNFYLGDIHEGNFLVDKLTGNINIIDLDSCKIGNNNPFPSKYLNTNKIIHCLESKYSLHDNGLYIQNKNTDFFCFIIMLLNIISGINLNKLDIEDFYEYLSYLKTIGYESELIKQLGNIYINEENYFDIDLLDYIPNNYRSSYKVFQYIKNKK